MKFYLDDGKNIEIDISFDGVRPAVVSITPRKYFKPLNPRIEEDILWNLYNIVEVKQHYDDINLFDLQIGGQKFFEMNFETREVKKEHSLTSFEVRRLAQAKYRDGIIGEGKYERPAIFPRDESKEFKIKTDLHAHLSAILSGKDLIQIGEECNISYPLKLAQSIGLDIEGLIPDEKGNLKLDDILERDPNNRLILGDSLEICPYTNETFNRMEEIYTARSPFSKNKDILEPILWKIAEKYVECGVEYAELSSTEVIKDVEFLSKMHDILPKIEEFWSKKGKTINIRFLAAIARDSIEQKKDDEIDILEEIAKSPYVVGCDFLGHESNPTSDIAPQIKEITRWAIENDPDFTIRVHAGETDIFNNVEDTLKLIKATYEEAKQKNPNAVLPPVRIGHAVYKVKTEEVDRLAQELNVVFECNATSNYGLNNISDYNSPLKKNLDKGIPTVIGTDGFGLYGTSPINEVVIAKGRGIKDFSLVSNTEQAIINRSMNRFKEKKETFDKALSNQMEQQHNGNISSLFRVKYRNGEPQYIGTRKERIDNENKKYKQDISEFLELVFKLGGATILRTPEQRAEFEKKIMGKKPIMIVNNALRTKSENLPEESPEIREIVKHLIVNADPKKSFFVIGGIKCGAENFLMHCLREVKDLKKFDVLSFVTEQAITTEKAKIEPKVITDVIMIENRSANILSSNFLLPKEMGDFMKEHKGLMLALGGSAVVADIVQYAFNVGDIDTYLSSEIKGTARNKTRQYDDFTRNIKSKNGSTIYSFATVDEFKDLLKENNPEIFIPDKRKFKYRVTKKSEIER